MRVRRRWVVVLVVAGLLAWQWPAVLDRVAEVRAWLGRTPSAAWKMAKVPDAVVSEVFRLDADAWLDFDLPPGHPAVRLLTTAELTEAGRAALPAVLPDTTLWPYALRYQLLDGRGAVLADREHHFHTRLSEYVDADLGVTITPAFYLGEAIIPADSRLAVLPLTGFPTEARRLRLRLLAAPEPLRGVAVRLLYPDPASEAELRYAWDRTLPDKQRRLAAGNVYPPDLLTDAERRNLFRHRWAPCAPIAPPGGVLAQRELYVLADVAGEAVRDRPPPAGTLAGPGRVAVLPIPEDAGRVRFVVAPLRPGDATPGRIDLRWYGVGLAEREAFHVEWTGKEVTLERTLRGGTVEVAAPVPVAVRAFRVGVPTGDRRRPAGSEEITPLPTKVWAYLLPGDGPVEFDVLHAAGEATPLRVDLRRMAGEPDALRTGSANGPAALPPAVARYEFLDAAGGVLLAGDLASDRPWSQHDLAHAVRQDFGVSEPSTYYFAAPAGAARLRFPPADAPLLVTVANRPGLLTNVTRVPEDYHRYNRAEVRQRNWFPVRSPGHDRLELANRVPFLVVQSRPPEDDPDLAAGRYEWFQFLPGGDWRGRQLLVPRDAAAPFRDEALPVTFREVPTGRDVALTFRAEPGRRETRPTLAFLRGEDGPFTVAVSLAGRPLHAARLDGSRGEVVLPAVPVGEAALRVETSRPARVFVNGVAPGKESALVKRLAVELTGSLLAFDYEKTDRARAVGADEMLSFTLHRPAGTTTRAEVRVRLEGAEVGFGPFPTFTFRDRVFEVRAASGEAVPVLHTRDGWVDAGQTFLFPVGADVPPGRYRVRVEPAAGVAGFLLMARSLPGGYDRREFFHEHPDRLPGLRGGAAP